MKSEPRPGQGEKRYFCPHKGCPWNTDEYTNVREELAASVDAANHYVEAHGGMIPEDAPFGDYQCPNCHHILGLDGTASCSECGFIPKHARDSNHDQ